MNGDSKTREQLLEELAALGMRVAALERERSPSSLNGHEPFEALIEDSPAITEEALAESQQRVRAVKREFQEKHAMLQAVVEGIPVAIFVKDRQSRYLLANSITASFFGRPVEEILGQDDTCWLQAEAAREFMEMDRRVIESGETETHEETATVAGATRSYLTTKTPFRGPHGEILGVLGISHDITKRTRAEREREQYAARLQALSRRLVQVQEEERRHLARELHDEIGQLLTSLKFAVEASAAAPPATAATKLDEVRALIDQALNRVRALSFDLRPALLDHLGLLPALRWLIENYTASTDVRVNFQHDGIERRFEPEVETAAFRIVQQALTNVARHANVEEAAVRVWLDGEVLEVQIEDGGVGFDPDAVLSAGGSTGLPGMHERVSLLGGKLIIDSAPGGGTHVAAQLPVAHLKERGQYL